MKNKPFCIFELGAPEEHNQQLFEHYREKYRDVLECPDGEPLNIALLLSILARQGDKSGKRALLALVRNSLEEMASLAKQDAEIAYSLVNVLSDHCYKLYSQSKKSESLRTQAATREAWPALVYRHAEHRNAMLDFVLKDLKLGALHPVNHSSGFSFTTFETNIAHQLFRRLNRERKSGNIELPLFCKENASVWWKHAKPLFIEHFGKDFPRHKKFQRYWAKFETKAWKQQLLKDYEKRDIVRKEILKQMGNAFRSIAKPRGAMRVVIAPPEREPR